MMKKFIHIVLAMIILFTYVGACEEITATELFLTSLNVILNTDEGVADIPVPGFEAENPERDYYFGIDEIPVSSELLPEINAVSNAGEMSIEYDFEPGGYVASIVITEGTDKEIYRLHFREAETAVIPVNAFFSSKGAYIRQGKDKFNVINNEYGYAEFDLSSLPSGAQITEITYSARNAYNPEPVTMTYSHYSTLDEVRAYINSTGGRNLDFSDPVPEIATNPIDSATSRFNCTFVPEEERIAGGSFVLILKKASSGVSYFYESQITVKYMKKDYNISDEITMGTVLYSGEDGGDPVIAEGNKVNLMVPVSAAGGNSGAKLYTVISVCYCNGKLVDSDFSYNIIEPGANNFEELTLTVGENTNNFSILTVIWDSAEEMHPFAYSQEYFGE